MFLIVAIIAIIAITVALFAFDKYVWSFLVMVASIAAAYYLLPEVAAFVDAIGWTAILAFYLPVYLGLGAATAVLKWLLFLRGVSSDISEMRSGFEQSYRPPAPATIPGDVMISGIEPKVRALSERELIVAKREQFLRHLRLSDRSKFESFAKLKWSGHGDVNLEREESLIDLLTPRAKQYIDRITFWVLQWPIVLLSLILEDLILKVGKQIARALDAVFNRLARTLVGNAVKGL